MSLKRVSPLPAFNGIPGAGVGGTATLDLPRGPRYHTITLKVKDSNNANASVIISELRLNVNGKVQRICSITDLDAINGQFADPAYNALSGTTRYVAATSGGAVTTAASILAEARSITTPATASYILFKDSTNTTYITIFFNEKGRGSGVGQAFAWPTGNVASFQLEADITTSAGTVTMSAYAEVDSAKVTVQGLAQQQNMPMGNIVKWYKTQMEVTGTTKNWTTFPYRRGSLLSVHFFDQYITNIQVKADSYEWRNISQQENLMLLAQNRMTGSASRFDLHLDYDDVVEGGGLLLDNIQDLQFNLTLSDGTARNVPVIVQVLGQPD
jgi:hypothetical protein